MYTLFAFHLLTYVLLGPFIKVHYGLGFNIYQLLGVKRFGSLSYRILCVSESHESLAWLTYILNRQCPPSPWNTTTTERGAGPAKLTTQKWAVCVSRYCKTCRHSKWSIKFTGCWAPLFWTTTLYMFKCQQSAPLRGLGFPSPSAHTHYKNIMKLNSSFFEHENMLLLLCTPNRKRMTHVCGEIPTGPLVCICIILLL